MPPEGYSPNDMRGKSLGNPELTKQNMRKIYLGIISYKKKYGKYPTFSSEPDLFNEMILNYKEYGLSSREEAFQLQFSPDTKYADDTKKSKDWKITVPYILADKRQDGTPIGSEKPAGKKDVLMWTKMYFHQNIHYAQGDKSTANPTGYYLVLWDDGNVEEVGADRIRYVRNGRPFPEYFPGQAGESPSGSLTRDEYYHPKQNP
jgi:hypothetical protein